MSAMLLKNHQNKQNLDMFYEFSNGGLFIFFVLQCFTPFVCIKTCYSVNNGFHPKVADSLAF